MNWDVDKRTRIKNINFIGGASLVEFKTFINTLPDQLPANMTAQVTIELTSNEET